jgi:glutathione S-transferase
MPKLYYTPTSCGASSFISAFLREISIECEVVDLMTHMTESGADFYTINPKGNVPTLVLDDGTILNENITCLEYIANMKGLGELAPEPLSSKRYQLQQILSFLATELHSAIGLFFNPASKDSEIRQFIQTVFDKKMKYLQKHIIGENKFVFENNFTIADAYLHIILSWTGYVGIDLSLYPVAHKYYQDICDLPGIKAAKNRMSTIPKTTF